MRFPLTAFGSPRAERPLRPSGAVRAFRLARTATGAAPPFLSRAVVESVAVGLSHRRRDQGWVERRRMLARHLGRVLGPDAPAAGSRALARLVDASVASYGRYWAETLHIPGLGERDLTAGITYDGYEHIAGGRAAGRGTILVLPHLGGWEWAGTQLAAIGHPVSVVVERLEPPDLFDWFTAFREELGMQVIPVGPGAGARCAAALADNHLLCLLADRLIEGTAGVDVEFFGETTALPAGPATLALRSGAALLPAAVYFEPRTDQHLGLVLPPVDTTRRGGFRADVTRVTQELAAAFEMFIRRAPTQWHMMQPNWPSDSILTGAPDLRPLTGPVGLALE